MSSDTPPIIDLRGDRETVTRQIDTACRTWGAFVAVGHNVDEQLLEDALAVGHAFFNLPMDVKQKVNLTLNGTRWRGYMPMGGESSVSGTIVDFKEGLYLGQEHAATDPRELAKLPTFAGFAACLAAAQKPWHCFAASWSTTCGRFGTTSSC